MSSEREWQAFNFSEIFIIIGGYYNKKPPLTENGSIPFLGATAVKNGITQFVSLEDIKKYDKNGEISNVNIDKRLYSGNCIAITNNGSVGYAYYQKNNFTCSHDITLVYLRECLNVKLNEYVALFLIKMIEQTGESFRYQRKWRPKRMIVSKILLPTDEQGNPDWKYMESEGKKIVVNKEKDLIEYLDLKIDTIMKSLSKEIISLSDKQWDEYQIQDLFQTRRVTGSTIKNYKYGIYPYVSSSATRNGIIGFVDTDKNETSKSNTITVNPISNAVFYQPYNFVGRGNAGSSINELHSSYLNKYIALFIVRMISHSTSSKTSYAIQLNGDRLKKAKFKLPVDEYGDPDWKFMEQYMKQLELKKLKQLKNYYLYK